MKVKNLECCCCGEGCRGRQWPNRDTGYGICSKCITWLRGLNGSEAAIKDNYGVEGYHFNIDENSEVRDVLGKFIANS